MRDGRIDRDRSTKQSKKTRGGTIVTILALVVFAFGLLGMIGLFGSAVKGFFCGAFGFIGYLFFALALLAVIFKGFVAKHLSRRRVLFTIVLALIFLVWLQILTSHAEFAEIEAPVSYRAYLNVCYGAGVGTSGGVLIGWIAYPLLSLIGKYAAIPLAVLFFVVLFFALLPWMRGSSADTVAKGPSSPREPKGKKEPKTARRSDEALRLFVDKVRPGQKDARKIKFRGFFAKKAEEPEFFDLTDDRPLYAPEGMVPESRPERYEVNAAPRSIVSEEEYYDDYTPIASKTEPDREERRPFGDRSSAIGDLPPFLRKYREEHDVTAETVEAPVPERPAPSAPVEQPVAPTLDFLPKTEVRKPKARLDDIISDVADLERVLGSAPKKIIPRTPDPAPVERKEEPVAAPVFAPAAEPARPAPIPVFERNAPAKEPEPILSRPAPVIPDPEPAEEPVRETPISTITPREASSMRPVEAPASAPRTFDVPVRPTPAPARTDREETEEEPIRTRKPRSDIGGTHRTAEPVKPVPSFIPPSKVKQPDIEEVMKEEEEAPARPYTAPPVSLLKEFPPIADDENVEEMGESLIAALKSFNIDSTIVDHKTGPTFTQFAVTLPDNMSVNKLTPLEKDIKRKLMVGKKDIRIISSVPDFDAVGIEVPNKKTSMVGLRSIINSPDFLKEGKLYFAIGVDVSGRPVYGDLLKMPHLLVAGSTGSGKSVCLNVMIVSMMYHYSPETVRFIMIDPKKVELSVYKNMPHMLMPSTVTEPDKAVNALAWAVDEMERRYQLLMENSCRNVGEYNALMKKTGGKKLYYIVFIIDEMADLMTAAKREVEEKVNRIAAKARAAGIHLVVATQRPSVDVITGTIKNNIPTRIAFKVTSFTDSKTILDRAGAENLFGYGDMLYMSPEGGEPIRLQGPYINDEISEIVDFIKKNNDCRFDNQAERNIFAAKEQPQADLPKEGGGDEEDGEDELFAPALEYFIEIGQASISKLQIKFRIGYGRAARIVAMMEERDYLTGAEGGNKTRSVKISREEFEAMYGNNAEDGGDAE